MRWKRTCLLCLIVALSTSLSACGEGEPSKSLLTTPKCGTIETLHALDDVWAASQPGAADFAVAKEKGVRTVINLRHAVEQKDFDERAFVEGLELTYVNLPWKKPEELTDEVFDKARELLNTAERPILLHCSSANRVGAVWLPWRVIDGGLSVEAALAEAKTIGLKKPEFEERALAYVAKHALAPKPN